MIVPMKKATIFALRDDREAILLALQRSAIMMVEENDGSVRDEVLPDIETSVQDTGEALKFLKKYREKPGFFSDAPTMDYDAFMSAKTDEERLSLEARAIQDEMAAIKAEMASADSAMEQLLPWLPLDIPIDEIAPTRQSAPYTGYIPMGSVYAFEALEEEHPVSVQVLDRAAGSVAVLAVCLKEFRDELSELLKDMGFVYSSPPAIQGLAQDEYDRLKKEKKNAAEKLKELELRAAEVGAQVQSVELLYDRLTTDLDRYSTPYNNTESTFYIQGWIVAERADELEETVRDATDVFELVLEEAAEGEKPPTLTRNNKFVTPFESVTDMFSRPNPIEGIDPNPSMAIWYWLLFGMMMADLGYGITIVLLFFLFKKIKKPKGNFDKLVTMLMYGGVTTAFWGIMFGSFFGEPLFKPVIGFVPLEEPIYMLLLCFGIGLLHLFCGFIVAAVYQFRDGNIIGGIADNICWIFILSGLIMLLLEPTKQIAVWVLLPAIVFKLFFSRRDTKNPIKRLFSGLTSLVGITNHVSDIISYSRIMALVLSGAVTAMVMNLMAGMLQGGFGWIFAVVVYIFGHVFNLAMCMLSAYVHTSRLQYIEFFGKFYEGGGYEFKPLSVESKYTVVNNER